MREANCRLNEHGVQLTARLEAAEVKVRELQGERDEAHQAYLDEYCTACLLKRERDAARGEAKREALGTLVKRWEIRAQDAANSSRRSYGEYDSGQERAYDDCIDGLRAALTAHQPEGERMTSVGTNDQRWRDIVAAFPKLTEAQVAAVKEVIDYHMFPVTMDFTSADEAHYAIQQDLDAMQDTP